MKLYNFEILILLPLDCLILEFGTFYLNNVYDDLVGSSLKVRLVRLFIFLIKKYLMIWAIKNDATTYRLGQILQIS